MDKKTVQYKRTLRGSVGAGVGALFNGNGRRYYVLVHKNASKYHKAGESQKLIIDQVEIGRDSSCQVRFDDSFETVSRRHAAIIKDGDNWKLVQLSQTNSTLLNGRKVDTEWYLENGDEIQLSIDGPRMGFIVPQGKQGLVSSIKMTERLELFRKQALRPYKTAIAVLFIVLLMVGAGSGYMIHSQGIEIKDLLAKSENMSALFAKAQDKWIEDSTKMARDIETARKTKKTVFIRPEGEELEKALDAVKPSVYAVITKVYISNETEKKYISNSQGTGFLLADGRFVTARHCVEPWMFTMEEQQAMYAISKLTGEVKIWAEIIAVNQNGDMMSFRSNGFKINKTYDTPVDIPYELEGKTINLTGEIACGSTASLGNDWAYIKTSKKGKIADGKAVSANLKSGAALHVLGFPKSLGISDGKNIVTPIYNNLSVSRDGLNDSRCIMVNQGIDHGNSGGPVFIMQKGKLYVVGIVSRGDMKSDLYNHLVPMSNLE